MAGNLKTLERQLARLDSSTHITIAEESLTDLLVNAGWEVLGALTQKGGSNKGLQNVHINVQHEKSKKRETLPVLQRKGTDTYILGSTSQSAAKRLGLSLA